MKIAQVCPYNIFRPGGVQSHILDLSEELRRRGHEVKIIAPKLKSVVNKQDDIILLGRCSELLINKTQIEISIAKGGKDGPIKRLLEKEKFDILHFHEPWVPVLGIQILSWSNASNVGTFHAASTDTLFSRSIEAILKPIARYVINSLDAVISVSEVPAEYIRDFYKGEIHIIPNGLNVNIFKPSNKPFKKYLDGKVNIFFLGRLDKRKGVIYLVKAFRRLKKRFKNVRLIIGGKGDELEKIQKYVKKHNIEDVEILGFVKEEDKPRYYATCDIFCSPALYGESFGIVLAEAMATGKPVVAGDNPGYRSVLAGRGELFLVNPKRTERFTKKLEILCRDKELQEIMGKWGLKKVQEYSWLCVCDQVLEVYKEALKNKHKRTSEKAKMEKESYKLLEKINGELKWGE